MTRVSLASLGLLVCVALGTQSAAAQTLNQADRAAIQGLVEVIEESLETQDYPRILDVAPPSILSYWAASAGITVEEFRALAETQMDSIDRTQAPDRDVTLRFDIALEGETETGRAYALIPTTAQFLSEEANGFRANSFTLALTENDAWWMMAIDRPSDFQLVFDVYPDLRVIAARIAELRSSD
jgi:hypothetical protein